MINDFDLMTANYKIKRVECTPNWILPDGAGFFKENKKFKWRVKIL